MKLTDRELEQLEAYWEGTLSEPERLALEQTLRTNNAFRRTADQLQRTLLGLQSLREQRLRRWMKNTDAVLPPIPSLPVQRNLFSAGQWRVHVFRPAIAVAAATLLILWLWRWSGPAQTQEQKLVAEAFEPYPVLGITLSDEEKAKYEAFNAYKAGQYKKAARLFEVRFQQTNDSLSLFYSGVSSLGATRAAQAVGILEKLRYSNSIPNDAANWYLALAYVAAKRPEEAKPILLELKSSDSSFKRKAADFLEKIN